MGGGKEGGEGGMAYRAGPGEGAGRTLLLWEGGGRWMTPAPFNGVNRVMIQSVEIIR